MSELRIALTFDLDNDFLGRPTDGDALTWRGLEQGAGLLLDGLSALADELGQPVPASWFARADRQIERECGSLLWCAERFTEHHRRSLEAGGHELQWHAHLYRRQADGRWEVEPDPAARRDQLCRAHAALREAGFDVSVSRIGECVFSEAIARTLRELGVVADATAMPGRSVPGRFDWSRAPQRPYRMDERDYQAASATGLWQIPFSMVPVRAPYDERPLRRYANPGFLAGALAGPLADAARERDLLVTISHPFEVLPEAEHALWGGTVDNYLANVRAAVSAARAAGKRVRFVRMGELASALASETASALAS